MAPFRPTYLNKRYYPGNASVIGPTTQATLGISTTTCFSLTNVCGACCFTDIALGCRCSFCSCPCCNVCCCCKCTVCTQTVPGGKWSKWEQYEASTRTSWGNSSTSSSDTAVCLCCLNVGFTCTGSITDYNGFFICCGSPGKWFVAPSCTQTYTNWENRVNAVSCANSLMGSLGWFVPDINKLQNPGYICRSYWDSYGGEYWSTSFGGDDSRCTLDFNNGSINERNIFNSNQTRAFRNA